MLRPLAPLVPATLIAGLLFPATASGEDAVEAPRQAVILLDGGGEALGAGGPRRSSPFYYRDASRRLSSDSVTVNGVGISSHTRPVEDVGCLLPEAPLCFNAALLAHNTVSEARGLEGTLTVSVSDKATGDLLLARSKSVKLDLEPFDDEDPDSIGFANVDIVIPRAQAARRALKVQTSWDGSLLEEIETRPVGRIAELREIYLAIDDAPAETLAWGSEMGLHVLLDKPDAGAPAEVTLRIERKIRYWFDTENTEAIFEIPAKEAGAFHLVLPFTPQNERQESTESYSFEVWVNGCLLRRYGPFH